MKLGYFLDKRLARDHINVTEPSEIKVRFASLYGLEKEKELLQDIVDYFKSDANRPMPHSSYYISGPLGCGKSSLTFALAKEANIPIISVDCSIFRSDERDEITEKMNLIFNVARKLRNQNGGCIITFKNAHELEYMEDESTSSSTNLTKNIFDMNLLQNLHDLNNIFMFLLAIGSITVSSEFATRNLFATELLIDYPSLAIREKLFKVAIKRNKVSIDSDVSINRLAKDTLGQTCPIINYIVKEAQLYAYRKKHSKVTKADFSEVIMKFSAGEKTLKMTEKERMLTAYHEAGHVIAGYFSDPDYKLSRVEITPRSQSLGLTSGDTDETKQSYFKKDFENLVIHYLGGMAAEELIFGDHTSGVCQDLSYATAVASNMIRAYGMGESLGPMIPYKDVADSLYTRSRAEKEINVLMKDLYKRCFDILSTHRDELEALTKALVEKEVVLGDEIKEIFDSVSNSNK